MHTYRSITKKGESLFKEKGSKFIGYAFNAESLTQVESNLSNLKNEHPKASHYCYAYKIHENEERTYWNDDGEPSNSAGKPILGQINSLEISNCLVVVVRYYGGTKLGVGGLQTAYKTAARLALENSIIETFEHTEQYSILFPFEVQGNVDYLLESANGNILQKTFDSQVEYLINIPLSQLEFFKSKMSEIRSAVLTKS